jgi:hypothetical protein
MRTTKRRRNPIVFLIDFSPRPSALDGERA